MFNLKHIFGESVNALNTESARLQVSTLPATIYMMQRDVINHYRHALEHYLTTSLNEPFLQNSSLGTPYDKWAYFTNEDFRMLSHMVYNLMSYSSRLIHESLCLALEEHEQFSQMKDLSNSYTSPITEISFHRKNIGIEVFPDNQLVITWLRINPRSEKTGARGKLGEPMKYFQIIGGNEIVITKEQYQVFNESISKTEYNVKDRNILLKLKDDGLSEISKLELLNQQFEIACNEYYDKRPVASKFDKLNQSYWT